MATNIPAPTVTWLGEDPTGSLGLTSHAFTANGTPDSVNAPFCPAGNFGSVDSGGCRGARGFVAASSEAYLGGDIADIDSGDLSACATYRRTSVGASARTLAGQRKSGTNDGWVLYTTSNGTCQMYVESDSGTAAANSAGQTTAMGWHTCCGTADSAGNVTAYLNGVSGTPVAYPAGTASASGQDLEIGHATGVGYMDGDILDAHVWVGTVLTAAQIRSYGAAVMGVHDLRGADPTCTSTGPLATWVGGQLEEFGDNWCTVGWSIPTGATGAGAGGCMLSSQLYTNDLLSSRDLSTNWTETGTSVVACSQSETPFRDGRQTCQLTDDDGAGLEYVSQVVPWAAASTGSKMAVCLYAYADSAQALDLQIDEATGGGCTSSTADFTAASIGSSWSQYEWIHTVADGDCTDFTVDVYPTDAATAGDTGHAYVVAQVFTGVDHCPAIYCETTSAGVTCGSPSVAYDASAIVDSGAFSGGYRIVADWMPSQSAIASTDHLWVLHDGSSSNRLEAILTSAEHVQLGHSVAGTPATILDSAVLSLSPGARWIFDSRFDYGADVYEIRGGLLLASSTATHSPPTGITTIQVGGDSSATQASAPASICNVRAYR